MTSGHYFNCLICVPFIRHQDNLTKTWFVSIGVVRWLHFRMDCITSLFLTVVTAIAVMTSQHAGEVIGILRYTTALLRLQEVKFHTR